MSRFVTSNGTGIRLYLFLKQNTLFYFSRLLQLHSGIQPEMELPHLLHRVVAELPLTLLRKLYYGGEANLCIIAKLVLDSCRSRSPFIRTIGFLSCKDSC